MNGRMDGQINKWMVEWKDGLIVKWKGGWLNGRMDGHEWVDG